METLKKGRGYYMKTISKAKASIIMQKCANNRWIKATDKQKKALGLMLANARREKKLTRVVNTI